MANVTLPIEELQAQIDTMMTQGVLIHFLKTSDFVNTADCPEDVLQALAEKIYLQNGEVSGWLEKLKYDWEESQKAASTQQAH